MSDLLDRDAAMKLRDTLADIIGAAPMSSIHSALSEYRKAIRALPAVQVAVKPGEIERAVWSAMMWAADNNPGFNGVPEYTDRGNSFAEDEARRAAARIRSALTTSPAPDAGKMQALVDAIEVLNAACDAMWNDHERLEENPGRFGQPYRLKEVHMKAISEAQQKLPAALAAMKEGV